MKPLPLSVSSSSSPGPRILAMPMKRMDNAPKAVPMQWNQFIPVKKVRFDDHASAAVAAAPVAFSPLPPSSSTSGPLKMRSMNAVTAASMASKGMEKTSVKTTIQRLRLLMNKALESRDPSSTTTSSTTTTTATAAPTETTTPSPARKKNGITQVIQGSSDLLYDPSKKILSCNGGLELFQGGSTATAPVKNSNVSYPLTVWGPVLQYLDSTHPERLMSTITPVDASPDSASLAFRLVGPEDASSPPYYAFHNLLGVHGDASPCKGRAGGYVGWNHKNRGATHLWNVPSPGTQGGFVLNQKSVDNNDDDGIDDISVIVADLGKDHARFRAPSIQLGHRETAMATLLASPNASTFFAPSEVNGTSPAHLLMLNGDYLFRNAEDKLTLHLQGVDADKKSVVSYSGVFFLTVTSIDPMTTTSEEWMLHTQGVVTPRGQVLYGESGSRTKAYKGLTLHSNEPHCITLIKDRQWTPTAPKRFHFSLWMMTSGK